MKYVILFFILSSCGILKDRKTDTTKERVRLVDRTILSEKAQGDKVTIMLPYPIASPQRPRAEIKTYEGQKGARVEVQFDSAGVVNRIDADCPEIDRLEQRNLELDYRIKEKEVERSANVDAINAMGKWLAIILIPGQLFFAAAWYFRGK